MLQDKGKCATSNKKISCSAKVCWFPSLCSGDGLFTTLNSMERDRRERGKYSSAKLSYVWCGLEGG